MAHAHLLVVDATIVEDEVQFSLAELARACQTDSARLVALVEEGVLQPDGIGPDDWRFGGTALRRARAALRLSRDLDIDASATALVLDLLDEISTLRARLIRSGATP